MQTVQRNLAAAWDSVDLAERRILLDLCVLDAVIPVLMIGLWLTRSASRSGEALLRSRLEQSRAPQPCKPSMAWHIYNIMAIPRHATERVARLLDQFPAVVLIGPRQVGKTTLALELTGGLGEGVVYLDLERPSDLAKLADPERFLEAQQDRLVVLDEIHRTPDLFRAARGDRSAAPRRLARGSIPAARLGIAGSAAAVIRESGGPCRDG